MNTDTAQKLQFALHSIALEGIQITDKLGTIVLQHTQGELSVDEFVIQAITAIKS